MIFKVDPIRKLRKTQQHLAQAWKVNSGFPDGSEVKESACDAGDLGSIPGSGIPGEGNGYPTPVFLTEEPHGQRSLVGYTLWTHKELDTTEQLTLSLFHSVF